MKNARNSLLKKGIQVIAAASVLATGQVASAANVTVRVVETGTLKPVSGVAVCMGTESRPGAYGAMRTNAKGEVRYAKGPNRDFILSVSGNGKGDYVKAQTARNFDIIYYVELGRSGANAFCLPSEKKPKNQLGKEALSLEWVDVKAHSHYGGTVDIATRVKGVVPTHIRASTNAKFEGASWLPYEQTTRHTIERVESENLYVQVKRLLSNEGGSVEAVSTARIGDLHWH